MSAVWDRRFAVHSAPASAPGPVTVGALGAAGVATVGRDRIDDDNPLPHLVYPTLPAVWDEAGLAAVPHLSWRREAALTARLPSGFTLSPCGLRYSAAGFTVV